MPYQSGGVDRDRSISRAGNPRARTAMIQLAWLWPRYQPASGLATWFRECVGSLKGRTRRIAIVAMGEKASDCALALCGDRIHTGRSRIRHGNDRKIDKQNCRGPISRQRRYGERNERNLQCPCITRPEHKGTETPKRPFPAGNHPPTHRSDYKSSQYAFYGKAQLSMKIKDRLWGVILETSLTNYMSDFRKLAFLAPDSNLLVNS